MAEGAFAGLVDEDKKAVITKIGDSEDKASTPKWESPQSKHADLNIDLASFIKGDINSYAGEKHGIKLTLKYLDPKRSIRASAPNAEDTQISHTLALSAAHSGMAGFTDFAVGLVRC